MKNVMSAIIISVILNFSSNTAAAVQAFNFDKESISFIENVSNVAIKDKRVFFTMNPVIDSGTKTITIYFDVYAGSSAKDVYYFVEKALKVYCKSELPTNSNVELFLRKSNISSFNINMC
ncbi:hypothetical protein [Enterobacter wuhouensis]|uniref:hypothetical protein n=1 Tax=Enterobacter wuhouensis TaxID=2529381 RepID=UPI0035251A04